jgi:hypothetical protein
MRFVGWLASALGLVGIVVCNGLASLVWVLRRDLRARAGDLLAVPDAGLEVAITLTDGVSSWLEDVVGRIADIRARADELVAAPVVDPGAANDLAAAIDDFISGPYATMRSAYTGHGSVQWPSARRSGASAAPSPSSPSRAWPRSSSRPSTRGSWRSTRQ